MQVDLWTYVWASAVGILPMGFVCVYLGTCATPIMNSQDWSWLAADVMVWSIRSWTGCRCSSLSAQMCCQRPGHRAVGLSLLAERGVLADVVSCTLIPESSCFARRVGRDVATIIRGGMDLPPTWILIMAIATVALVALAAVLMAHYANQVQCKLL